EHARAARSARDVEEKRRKTGRSRRRDRPYRAGLAAYGPVVSRSGRVSLGALCSERCRRALTIYSMNKGHLSTGELSGKNTRRITTDTSLSNPDAKDQAAQLTNEEM